MNTKSINISIILLTLLATSALAQVCGNTQPSDQLQSGTFLVSNQRSQPRYHSYTIPINNFQPTNAGFEVAVSTESINGYNPAGGFDYKVNGGKQAAGNSLVLSLFIDEDNRWSNMRLSYLVSAWNQMILGSFIGNPFDSSNSASDTRIIVQSYIPLYKFKKGVNYDVSTFISGFRTQDSTFNLQLVADAIDSADGRIVVQIQSNSAPAIELIQISYVIFPKQHSLYSFNGPSGLYTLSGPQNFIGASSNVDKFSLCKKNSQPPQPPQRCQGGQILQDGTCRCQNGYIEAEGICRRVCGQNSYINIQQRKCFCLPGFVQYSALFSIINCRPGCPQNQILNGQQCVCAPGFYRNQGGVCIKIPDCAQNQEWYQNQQKCDCKAGFSRNRFGQCVKTITCGRNQRQINNRCECIDGFEKINNVCIPVVNCGQNEILNPNTRQCQCRDGFIRLGPVGPCVSRCPINTQWIQGQCVCIAGYAKINNVCRQCPNGSVPSPNKENCNCQGSNTYFSVSNLRCAACPQFSTVNSAKTGCQCNSGYQLKGQACVKIVNCQANSSPDSNGNCICNRGYYLSDGICKQQPNCPNKSTWNQQKLECMCDQQNHYIIGNICQPCGQNQGWNGSRCVCKTGFFKINGVCRTCDSRTTYNGQDCICNIGFYGNRDSCSPCHSTCGKCNGPNANQCITCVDISFTLLDGFCSKTTPCGPGFFLDTTGNCNQCSPYCQSCTSIDQCSSCSVGFKLQTQNVFGQVINYCESICGDGRKNDQEDCDDGNTKNGDGCSSLCEIENGWSCTGGSTIRKSVCNKFIPTRSIITLKGAVNSAGKILQSVRLSYIPTCFTDNECADCFDILKVSIDQALVNPYHIVSYIPNSQGQFLIEFSFPTGIINTSALKFTVRINDNLPPQYNNCFSQADLDQRVTKVIDPATLVIAPVDQALTLDDFGGSGNQIKYNQATLDLLNNLA